MAKRARFGPQNWEAVVSVPMVIAPADTHPPTSAPTDAEAAADPVAGACKGKVVLVRRADCDFVTFDRVKTLVVAVLGEPWALGFLQL